MKKSALKIIVSALLAPGVMLCILFITGLTEIIFQTSLISGYLEALMCICAVPALLILERKMKLGELTLACNAAYFISAVVFAVPVFWLAVSYADNLYSRLNAWDHGWFSGIQWIFYLIFVYAQVILHFIIRIIIAVARKIKKERRIADKEKYGNEE